MDMWTRTAAAAALVLALAACSSDGGRTDPEAAAPSSGPRSLKDTCAEVAAVVRDVDVVNPQRKIDAAREKLVLLSQGGDAETRDALTGVVDGLARVRKDDGPRRLLAAFGEWTDSVGELGDRCAAVGSVALQRPETW
jgi:hypothetical protein